MIQDLRSSKCDLVDIEFLDVNSSPVTKTSLTTHRKRSKLVPRIYIDLLNIIRGLLTAKCHNSRLLDPKRRPCELRFDHGISQVAASHALRTIVQQAAKVDVARQASLVLTISEWRAILEAFSCTLKGLRCDQPCTNIFDSAISDTLVLRLRATFPRGLKAVKHRQHSTRLRSGPTYTLADVSFLCTSEIKSIRPRCSTSGTHFTNRKRHAETYGPNSWCENHTEDDHSDCESESDVDPTGDSDVSPTHQRSGEDEAQEDTTEEEAAYNDDPDSEEVVEEPFVPTRTPTSPAELQWVKTKEQDGISNRPLDEIMDMIGLEDVKSYLLQLLGKINTVKRQGIDLSRERLGAVFLGNPGTGKTTVARLYSKFLSKIGALGGSNFVEISGVLLARDGVHEAKRLIESLYYDGNSALTGGTFFVDDAYQLIVHGGERVLDYLLGEIENKRGKVAFVFAGYEKQMEQFLAYNPGMASRLPHRMIFADFSQPQLLELLKSNIVSRYKESMKIEDGPDGLYMRVLSRRLARRAGNEGFGNARDVENALDRTTTRQATRLEKLRRNGEEFDDFFFTKEDIIGSEPVNAMKDSDALKKLDRMVGLQSVKRSLQDLVDRYQDNYKRELKELPIVEAGLNRLFLGSPGTGKTTVAKLYAQILAEIGLLSTSNVMMRVAADFIGQYIGESELFTKQILEAAKGKVLIIDEAYMLAGPKRAGKSEPDEFRQGVIDTIVSMVQGHPGEDRAVLLLGYEDRMMDFLRDCNPGLMRRFPPESAFYFEDYNDEQLLSILETKLEDQGIEVTDYAKTVALDVLSKCRRRPNFGNAGEIDNLLGRAKARFQRRISHLSAAERTGDVLLQPEDFDPEYNRIKDAVTNCRHLFRDVVGCEEILERFIGYIHTADNLKKMQLELEEYLPFNFIFKGPPGTGKTTTARKIGKIFYDMGLLATTEVVGCSVTDLVGEYIGWTGPKVTDKLDKALGKVLFIDEAYRLGESPFSLEALDEIVDCLTKPRYKGKLIIVLAGYEDEMNDLIHGNPGLSSRFSEEVLFNNLEASDCLELLIRKVETIPGLRMSALPRSQARHGITAAFSELSQIAGWGNGRDIETLAKRIVSTALRSGQARNRSLEIPNEIVIAELKRFYNERQGRSGGESGGNRRDRRSYHNRRVC